MINAADRRLSRPAVRTGPDALSPSAALLRRPLPFGHVVISRLHQVDDTSRLSAFRLGLGRGRAQGGVREWRTAPITHGVRHAPLHA